jgi:hypothetical protein
MSLMTLINDLGEDADLLICSDEWLESERRTTAIELDRCANELRVIYLAQRIKKALQQKNLVAVQELIRSIDGNIQDILIRILDLPKALRQMKNSVNHDHIDILNAIMQYQGWKEDGYDVELCE